MKWNILISWFTMTNGITLNEMMRIKYDAARAKTHLDKI